MPLPKKIVGAQLKRAAGGADEVAEDGDVGAVNANAAGIDREAELFGLFEIDTRVVEFREAETLRGQNAIEARRIDGTGRTMPFPRTPRYLVELLPVAFVPGLHSLLLGCVRVKALTFPLCRLRGGCHFYFSLRFHYLIRLAYCVGCSRYLKGSPCLQRLAAATEGHLGR